MEKDKERRRKPWGNENKLPKNDDEDKDYSNYNTKLPKWE